MAITGNIIGGTGGGSMGIGDPWYVDYTNAMTYQEGKNPSWYSQPMKSVNMPPVMPVKPNFQSLLLSTFSPYDTYTKSLQSIMSIMNTHINAIARLISRVIVDFKNGEEWTKADRYAIWFDKWADATDGILYRKNSALDIYEIQPLLKNTWTKLIFDVSTFNLFKNFKGFNPEILGKGSTMYYIGAGNYKVSVDSLFTFFPEIASTFANTFLYRIIEMKTGDKERKVTILNQKLPDHIKKAYKDLSSPISDIDKLYSSCLRALPDTYPDRIEESVIGFVRGKSYLDHVKPHIGQESLLTCDINKFYNSVNLKNIIDNKMFNTIMMLILEKQVRPRFSPHYEINMREWQNYFSEELGSYLRFIVDSMNSLFFCLMSFYTCNGMLPTGSYASPAISNILLIPFDYLMVAYADKNDFIYTRYVDDICMSSEKAHNPSGDYKVSIKTAEWIEHQLNSMGLFLKYKKTKIFGPKDVKVIANLNLPKKKGEPPSIGSKFKLQLKEYFNDKNYADLTAEDLGRLNWVKYVNEEQYKFIISGIKNWPSKPSELKTLVDDMAKAYYKTTDNTILASRSKIVDFTRSKIGDMTKPIYMNAPTMKYINVVPTGIS